MRQSPAANALATLSAPDAELAVIGGGMIDPAALAEVRAVLDVEAFADARHRVILGAMIALQDSRMGIDPITISEQLRSRGELEKAGGNEYLGYLIDAVPTAANIAYHLQLVRIAAERRRLRELLLRSADVAADPALAPAAVAQHVLQDVLPIAVPQGQEGFVPVKNVLWPVMERIEGRALKGGGIVGAPSGYPEIDLETGGFRAGELVVIAGVPGSGKTAIVVNLAWNALHAGVPTAVISCEMPKEDLVERFLVRRAKVSTSSLRRGRLDAYEMAKIAMASGELSTLPLLIDDTPGIALETLAARCRHLKAMRPDLGLLLIDYLQLITSEDETRAEELRGISYALKGLAKELRLPVIAMCQLNDKDVEKHNDKRPTLADLQGSSGMRQAADFIGLLYRAKMYGKAPIGDPLELQFAKSRAIGTFKVTLECELMFMDVQSTYVAPTETQERLGL